MSKHETLDAMFDGARVIVTKDEARKRGLTRFFTGKAAKTPSQWKGLPAIHAERAIAREHAVYEWQNAYILGEA
jgi:hypothetical protein